MSSQCDCVTLSSLGNRLLDHLKHCWTPSALAHRKKPSHLLGLNISCDLALMLSVWASSEFCITHELFKKISLCFDFALCLLGTGSSKKALHKRAIELIQADLLWRLYKPSCTPSSKYLTHILEERILTEML